MKKASPARIRSWLAATGAALLLAACAAAPPLDEGKRLVAQGRPEEALAWLEQAMREHPDDMELRAYYYRQRELILAQLLAAADAARLEGQASRAEQAYRRVLAADPGNAGALAGLERLHAARRHEAMIDEAQRLLEKGEVAAVESRLMAILAENPAHLRARALLKTLVEQQSARAEMRPDAVKGVFSRPITLEFRDAPLRSVFEMISRASGVNFVFDKDVRPDIRVTIFVRDTSIDEVIRLILVTNQLERKLLNENSVLVYPNTPAKAKEYQELVVKSFYLANADARQALTLVKSMVKSRDVFMDDKLNLLVVRDTPEAVRLVERLLQSLDLAEPEVMLEVEVMEVSRSKLQELGLRFPDQVGYGILTPNTTTTVITTTGTQTTTNLGGTLAPGFVNLREREGLVPFVTNPALTLMLRSELGDNSLLANPRIRVKNKEKARVHIGEKLPVFTTTSTANVGVSSSVSYLDVGLKLEVEPVVTLEEEVSIKVGLEVSSVVREVPGPQQSLAYQVGTRSALTTLRLKNGETQVLAGLINDEERDSVSRVPGLGEIPVIGRLFSSNRDSASKTEIVLLITPRILRNIARPESQGAALPSGTDSAIGAAPLRLKPTAPGSLALAPQAPGAPAAATAPDILPPGAAPERAAPVPRLPLSQGVPLALAVPRRAGLQEEFVVTGSLPAASGAQAAEVDLTYDAGALAPSGETAYPGRATLRLAPAGGAGVAGQIRFRVTALTPATIVLQVAEVRASTASGEPVTVLPPAPATIELVP